MSKYTFELKKKVVLEYLNSGFGDTLETIQSVFYCF